MTINPTDINQPLRERTLLHGRNVMAVSSVLITLAWVPGIDVAKFHPFGFEFTDDSLLSAWLLLLAVLLYYAVRFWVDNRVDYAAWWDQYGPNCSPPRPEEGGLYNKQIVRLNKRYKMWDRGLPYTFAAIALIATVSEIWPLLQF